MFCGGGREASGLIRVTISSAVKCLSGCNSSTTLSVCVCGEREGGGGGGGERMTCTVENKRSLHFSFSKQVGGRTE